MVLLICVFIGLVSVGVQAYLWLCIYDRVSRHTKTGHHHDVGLPPVSLIIAVRDGLDHLNNHLPRWLSQQYPDFEILIVDDHSSTRISLPADLLGDQLHIVHLDDLEEGKKAALTAGIGYARHDWIVTTDVDCYPASDFWLSDLMAEHHKADVILGYSPYRSSGGFLSRLVAYESWYVALQYLSAALAKRPYMAVGRNLAYRKEVFRSVNGFEDHKDLVSGDDDLLINAVRSDHRVVPSYSKNAWVYTYPAKDWSSYWRQKRRHLTTAPRYNAGHQVALLSAYLSQFLFYVATAVLLVLSPWVGISLLVFRVTLLYIIGYRVREQLPMPLQRAYFVLFDFILCVWYFVLSFTYLRPLRKW